jgi:hypothetical protein
MARSLRFDPEASNEASKKRGCYRTRSDESDRQSIKKPLFFKGILRIGGRYRTLLDMPEYGEWLPGLDSNQRPFD